MGSLGILRFYFYFGGKQRQGNLKMGELKDEETAANWLPASGFNLING